MGVLLALALTGCATVDKAQWFDGATTWYGLSQGSMEANPLLSGLNGPGIIVTKLVVTQLVKLTPETYCVPATRTLTATGIGAGIWNLAVVANSWWAAIPVIAVVAWEYWGSWGEDAKAVCADPFPWFSDSTDDFNVSSFGDRD